MKPFHTFRDSWLAREFGPCLGMDPFNYGRWPTFQIALNLFKQRDGLCIVETGCQRAVNDWGAGCSTFIFSTYIIKEGGHLTSIDNSEENLNLAKSLIPEAAKPWTVFICDDSVHALENINQRVDLLYLDSLDYPYGPILDEFGGKTDLNGALERLKSVSDDYILSKYENLVAPCQEHCLRELQVAQVFLNENSIVLIDDANLAGGGKARLAKKWLAGNGWHCILDAYQSLWIREPKQMEE